LPAIAELNIEVTMSVYVELTLASIVEPDRTQYDRHVSSAEASGSTRKAVMLLLVLLAVSGCVFVLAKLHLARPGVPKAVAGAKIVLGDFYRGQTTFSQKCAACHGSDGKGGPIGPKLDGLSLSLPAAKAQIDGGGSTMPAGLVTGSQESDVLAFLATILKSPS
jgi:mono/diheme cytochrome c family protein